MKIYTKGGDKGETGLFGGSRVSKNDQRIEAYGTIDELNSVVGLILSESHHSETADILLSIQSKLFIIGSELATPNDVKNNIEKISHLDIEYLEGRIDHLEQYLTPLKNFILPGGCKSAALLHFARTVCRRSERRIVKISSEEKINSDIIVYINRHI